MSKNRNELSDKQTEQLYEMIRKRSFYAVVAELRRLAGEASDENVPETTDNWRDVEVALGCAIGLMDDQELALRVPKPEPARAPQPRGDRRIRLR